MSLPDFSEYLKLPGKLQAEEAAWQASKYIHIRQAKVINEACKKYKLKSVIEIGCATGNILNFMDKKLFYWGYDKNEYAVDMARKKFPQHSFGVSDIRELEVAPKMDLVFSFAILKHFDLGEWNEIFQMISRHGKYFIFDINILRDKGVSEFNDGIKFNHVWFTMDEIKKRIDAAGLELLDIFEPEAIDPIFICKKK